MRFPVSTNSAAFRAVAPEVFYASEPFAVAGPEAVELIKRAALSTPRRRCRICFHSVPQDRAQEMLIAMHCSSYVRPHRHLKKTETLTILEGAATALLFDEAGIVIQRLLMKPYGSEQPFFYRMPQRVFHTLRFEHEWTLYLETTTGPFDPISSEAAPWAPPENDSIAGLAYLDSLIAK